MSLEITGKKYFVSLLIESLTVGATINSFHKSSGISYFSITSLLSKIHKDRLSTLNKEMKKHIIPKVNRYAIKTFQLYVAFECLLVYILWYHISFYYLYNICNENNCTNSHTHMLELFSSSLCLDATLKCSRPEMLFVANPVLSDNHTIVAY